MHEPGRRNPIHLPVSGRAGDPVIIFITLCTKDRQPHLATEIMHALLREVWADAERWCVGRYVILPDHLHLFCAPAPENETPLASWIRYWKSTVSRQWHALVETSTPLWERHFWDRQLRSGESYSQKMGLCPPKPRAPRPLHPPRPLAPPRPNPRTPLVTPANIQSTTRLPPPKWDGQSPSLRRDPTLSVPNLPSARPQPPPPTPHPHPSPAYHSAPLILKFCNSVQLSSSSVLFDSFVPAHLIRSFTQSAPPSELPLGSLSHPCPRSRFTPSGPTFGCSISKVPPFRLWITPCTSPPKKRFFLKFFLHRPQPLRLPLKPHIVIQYCHPAASPSSQAIRHSLEPSRLHHIPAKARPPISPFSAPLPPCDPLPYLLPWGIAMR